MPAIQEQKEVTSLNHSIKGRSLLLHLKRKIRSKIHLAKHNILVPNRREG